MDARIEVAVTVLGIAKGGVIGSSFTHRIA